MSARAAALHKILADGELIQALVVVSDVAQQVEAERAVAEQREFVDVVEKLVRDRSGLLDFVTEADVVVRRLVKARSDRVEVERDIHTLRGDASIYGLSSFAEYCRTVEARMHDTDLEIGVPNVFFRKHDRVRKTQVTNRAILRLRKPWSARMALFRFEPRGRCRLSRKQRREREGGRCHLVLTS